MEGNDKPSKSNAESKIRKGTYCKVMKMNRVWAMPNKWTFKIPPIAELLARYVGDGKGWIDPFAGMYSPAEFTNDLIESLLKNADLKFPEGKELKFQFSENE